MFQNRTDDGDLKRQFCIPAMFIFIIVLPFFFHAHATSCDTYYLTLSIFTTPRITLFHFLYIYTTSRDTIPLPPYYRHFM